MNEPLRYKINELIKEVRLMRNMANGFLAEDAVALLRQLEEQIELLHHRTQLTTISINPKRPIITRQCKGGYERDCGGKRKDLFGELFFKWELQPVGAAKKKHQAAVIGIASSVARLKINHQGEATVIASWRMELGDNSSPGTFFHAQIPDTFQGNAPMDASPSPPMWPSWLPVPRLPIPAMTPMLALEFLLAEIFQDRWPKHMASGGYDVDEWRALQRDRYVKFFEWQRKNAQASGQGSPLLAMKAAKPPRDMFVSP